jgi:hypothetical protein
MPGLGITLHAGEADVAERVLEAGRLGARRIGHGVRLVDALHDPARTALVDEAKALGLHLEVCPTSNVHTGAAESVAAATPSPNCGMPACPELPHRQPPDELHRPRQRSRPNCCCRPC